MSLRLKRGIVIIASLLVGLLGTVTIIYGPAPVGFSTNVQDFAYSNVVLLFLSIASIAGIWLDYFLETQFLKS
jgi:hypothetical protein